MIEMRKYQHGYLAKIPAKAIAAADTGTGKTFMSLQHYIDHAPANTALLILAPAPKIKTNDWTRDVQEFFAGRMEKAPVKIWIMSYEKFSRRPTAKQSLAGTRGQVNYLLDFAKNNNLAVIADEVHKAKNSQSLQGQAVCAIAKVAKTFIGLSATPASNGWVDVANYFKIFGFAKNKTAFFNRYVAMDRSRGFPVVKGYFHESEIKSLWNSVVFPLAKSDVLDMPAQTFKRVDFVRPKEYITIFQTHKKLNGDVIENPSAFSAELRKTLATKEKLDYLAEIIDGTDENIVIFYNYNIEFDKISEMLAKKFRDRKVYRQNGKYHELPNKADFDKVKRSITLAQYKSGSTAVEMTYATITVFFSPTYSYQEYKQAQGRTYRSGQTKPVVFFQFSTQNSLEKDAWNTLANKKDFSIKQYFAK